MSFFANLLGGAMQGVGSGMTAMAADEERLARDRALVQERSAAALELQQQRIQDRRDQHQQMMQMRSEPGGVAGSGGKGMNLAQMAMQARTPEEQDRIVALARTFEGDHAVDKMVDTMFGRPRMVSVAPTAGDFARYDRAGDMNAAPPTTTLERAAYDREKGAQALQRLYTLFLDPGKIDAHARGERQFGLNDRAEASAMAVEQGGGSALDVAAAFQRGSAPQPERPGVRPGAESALQPMGSVPHGGTGAGSLAGTGARLARPLSSAPRDGSVVRDANGLQYVVRNGRPERQAKAR
jgi:hypothetical protein